MLLLILGLPISGGHRIDIGKSVYHPLRRPLFDRQDADELVVQDEPDRMSAGGFDLSQAIREVIPRQHDIRDGRFDRRVYGLEKDTRVEPALLQNQAMRSHQSGKALVVGTRHFARGEMLQAE